MSFLHLAVGFFVLPAMLYLLTLLIGFVGYKNNLKSQGIEPKL
ncbi:hypothetical protein [Prochlorococcus sp. MIT 0601]|nr:hypothetical protein [Prochlorococcus sp. MIT 0601]KGG12182.1 hypothetical protein EV05_1387 [Prochlorococcus sp. MIT 0601]